MKILSRHAAALIGVFSLATPNALADEAIRLREELKETRAELQEIETRLEQLEESGAGTGNALTRSVSSLNPEIGVIADIVYINTESSQDLEGNDKLSVRELELIIGSDIDPYARFDSTLTFSDFEDFVIEEAYVTLFALPWELKGRLGRVRPTIGKINPLHLDQQDASDYPLVIQEYLGLDGWFVTGSEFSRLFNLSSDSWTGDLLFGAVEGGVGEGGTMFGDSRRDPTVYARVKSFWDLSDQTSLELGGNWLQGSSSEEEEFDVTGLVGDLTFIHHFDANRRLKLQSELWWQDRDQPASGGGHGHGEEEEEHHEEEEDEGPTAFRSNPLGLYVLADFRLSDRFGIGGRYDFVEPINLDEGSDEDTGGTAYLTFYQSEFFRWRAQYQHVNLADGQDDNRFWLQATIGIGVHKHALQ